MKLILNLNQKTISFFSTPFLTKFLTNANPIKIQKATANHITIKDGSIVFYIYPFCIIFIHFTFFMSPYRELKCSETELCNA